MSFLQHALTLAANGFYVFPLQVGGKLPAIDDFPNLATRDPEQIKKWWYEPVLEIEQPFNIGISTTKYNGSQALVVVDVDNKGKKKGSEELLRLELEGFEFSETAAQCTPTGGEHLIYRTKEAVKQGQSVLGEGLDIRSKGGYIVGPGSVIDGKFYRWKTANGAQVEPCPEWIVERCGRAIEREVKAPLIDVNPTRAKARAQFYLDHEAPVAIEGQAGDQTTFKVAAHLKDLGVTQVEALDLLLGHWNPRCEPPWSPEELTKKIENAYAYGIKAAGADAPEAVFTPVKELDAKSYLHQINEHHAVLFNDGEVSVLFETIDEKGFPKREFLKEATFRRKFSPYLVGEGRNQKSYADVWLDWKGRREYKGLCFKPELQANNGYYNLWRGFTVKEKSYAEATPSARLGFDLFLDHIKANVCQGEDADAQWLLGYFAHLIQKPYERPETTLVFKGRKGVGKNVLVDRVGKLLGAGHYIVAYNPRYLTSQFNGHMDSCLLLVLDEAFWSGDKASDSALKSITTSKTIPIERKGKEPYTVDNLTRLVVIGNDEWLVPASDDERRYAVFNVGEGRKQDQDYFGKLCTLMDTKGGAEVLMHYLKNFDLSKVNVNKAPNTAGLAEQKLNSLSPFEQFWLQCLIDGKIVNGDSLTWQTEIPKETIRRALSITLKERNIKGRVPTETQVGIEIMKLCPGTVRNQKMRVDNDWVRSYRFPELDVCRAAFETKFNLSMKW